MALSTMHFVRQISTSSIRKFNGHRQHLPPAIEKMNNATRSLLELERIIAHRDHHAEAGTRRWKIISLAACPVIILLSFKIWSHHLTHEHPRPPYKNYEHLHIINKKFPWRDGKTPLFYNPKVNPIPGVGYEDEQ